MQFCGSAAKNTMAQCPSNSWMLCMTARCSPVSCSEACTRPASPGTSHVPCWYHLAPPGWLAATIAYCLGQWSARCGRLETSLFFPFFLFSACLFLPIPVCSRAPVPVTAVVVCSDGHYPAAVAGDATTTLPRDDKLRQLSAGGLFVETSRLCFSAQHFDSESWGMI